MMKCAGPDKEGRRRQGKEMRFLKKSQSTILLDDISLIDKKARHETCEAEQHGP